MRRTLLLLLLSSSLSYAADQGCPNEGADTRSGGTVICFMQRHLSFHTRIRPLLLPIRNVAIAFPPYIVTNHLRSDGRVRMFRVGWRYDRNWVGYIFPTAAYKVIDRPLKWY